jgi:type II secretory pathway pseudopilin PulG
MLPHSGSRRRRAATLVENAVVLPTVIILLLALLVGAMGVFRYQEVATLAREGARYASTHGYQYRKDAGLALGSSTDWSQDIYTNAIQPQMIALDPGYLTFTASWPDVINQPGKPDNWPGSQVTITVNYQWMPEWGLVGPITLTSTSSMPITN